MISIDMKPIRKPMFLQAAMRNFALLSIFSVLALTACNGSDTNSSTPTAGSNSAAANNGSASETNTSPAINSPTTSNSTTGSSPGEENPSRVYQLKDLEKIVIHTHGGDLRLWVMDTESKRQEGMMFLQNQEVKDNEGMIFVFPDVQKLSGNYAFWMHNTVLPLDIDYIAKDKKVLNIGKGVPFSDDPVKPTGDYFYVIEVKQGLSQRFGLVPGAKVDIPSNLVGKP